MIAGSNARQPFGIQRRENHDEPRPKSAALKLALSQPGLFGSGLAIIPFLQQGVVQQFG